jgi:hypothetical protein
MCAEVLTASNLVEAIALGWIELNPHSECGGYRVLKHLSNDSYPRASSGDLLTPYGAESIFEAGPVKLDHYYSNSY